MKSRERVLEYLAADYRVAGVTAGEALTGITPAMGLVLSEADQRFFLRHADDPCHEVARACNAGHVWRGNENRE